MNPKRVTHYLLAAILIAVVFFSLPTALFAQQGDDNSLLFPQDSQPFGMTYGDWAAAWWQYVFSIPASTNPLLDTTGEYCNVAQSSGPVFFLNSTPYPDVLVTRTCTVPSKALLLATGGTECSTLESPPFNGTDPQELRTCAGTIVDGIDINRLKLTIDGKKVHDLRLFRAQSPFFDFIMPANDNILGLEGVTSGSSVSDEYIVMLKPLSRGNHVIHFEGAYVSGPFAGVWFGVTYNLTVQ